MKYTKQVGKHEFSVICDKEGILSQILRERCKFEENYFQRYYTIGYEDGYLSNEEYNQNLDKMVQALERMTTEEYMSNIIDVAQKKKNGTLYKGRVADAVDCDNCKFIIEWHNTWIYNQLKVKAVDDKTLEITYSEKADTPA